MSLAVPVPIVPTPLAALVLSSHTSPLSDDDREALLTALRHAAARLGDYHHWRRGSPSTREGPTTLPITAKGPRRRVDSRAQHRQAHVPD
jgi:hypothetical protein